MTTVDPVISMDYPSLLIIDDEPKNFDVIETLLSDQDYQLYYAANGEEAINSLDLFNPDVILLDVMMPGIDGIEVCQRIKAMGGCADHYGDRPDDQNRFSQMFFCRSG